MYSSIASSLDYFRDILWGVDWWIVHDIEIPHFRDLVQLVQRLTNKFHVMYSDSSFWHLFFWHGLLSLSASINLYFLGFSRPPDLNWNKILSYYSSQYSMRGGTSSWRFDYCWCTYNWTSIRAFHVDIEISFIHENTVRKIVHVSGLYPFLNLFIAFFEILSATPCQRLLSWRSSCTYREWSFQQKSFKLKFSNASVKISTASCLVAWG